MALIIFYHETRNNFDMKYFIKRHCLISLDDIIKSIQRYEYERFLYGLICFVTTFEMIIISNGRHLKWR